MKNIQLTKNDDLSLVPSDALNEKVLDAMLDSVTDAVTDSLRTTVKRAPQWKKLAACAAMVCMMLVLMGAGYRVFDYLAYVPGQGILTQSMEEVYTLKEAVQESGCWVEAMSMVPVTEGENEGMWEVTVLTNRPVHSREGEWNEPDMTMTDGEGNVYSLPFSGGSDSDSRYEGFVSQAAAGDYVLNIKGTEYPVTMQALESSVYADYEYPISDGITVICFPMADGSDKLVMDLIIEPESENMAFWAEHCGSVKVRPYDMEVIDVLGNTYRLTGSSGSSCRIPESERFHGINSLLNYRMEYSLRLDRRLEAPVAQIRMEGLEITFDELLNTDAYRFTVPALNETAVPEDGGVFVDTHGIRAAFDTISSYVDDVNNTYEVSMTCSRIEFDFEEAVQYARVILKYETADSPERQMRGSATWKNDYEDPLGISEITYSKDIVGYGDKKIRSGSLKMTFGEDMVARPDALALGIEGEWLIDFTEPAEAAE